MNTVWNPWRDLVRSSVVCVALLVAGCDVSSWIPTTLKPYRIDIQQGNAVTQEMAAKLKPGMTRAQVRFALGTPLVVDPFRSDRWDYVYYYDKPGAPREYRHIVVIFKGDRLERLEGDVTPSSGGGKAALGIDKPVAAPGTPSAASKTESAPAAKSGKDTPSTTGQSSTNDKAAKPVPKEEGGFFGRKPAGSIGF
jgi:outer membrane protein assembly factor BamE